jgi:L-lactate dehydrogenase complex protein LldG
MTSREAVLTALRRVSPPASPLPEPPPAIAYSDPVKQFADVVSAVGGVCIRVADLGALNAELARLGPYGKARKIASLVPGAGTSNVDLASIRDPHELEGIDVAIIPGEFGVAENAAVWVPGSTLGPHRAIFVIAEHLVIVVPADRIVQTMHEAYARIRIERPGFGLFICGPSKTADIEQALVIGAHGPRSCTVFLLG